MTTKRRTRKYSLSGALLLQLTANLSLALRAARVKIRCPSEAYVRAGNFVEGFRSTRSPSNPPHKAAGSPVPGGDASLAGVQRLVPISLSGLWSLVSCKNKTPHKAGSCFC